MIASWSLPIPKRNFTGLFNLCRYELAAIFITTSMAPKFFALIQTLFHWLSWNERYLSIFFYLVYILSITRPQVHDVTITWPVTWHHVTPRDSSHDTPQHQSALTSSAVSISQQRRHAQPYLYSISQQWPHPQFPYSSRSHYCLLLAQHRRGI